MSRSCQLYIHGDDNVHGWPMLRMTMCRDWMANNWGDHVVANDEDVHVTMMDMTMCMGGQW